MKKIITIGAIVLSVATYALSNEQADILKNIDAEYQELLAKEAEKLEEFKNEKIKFEEELARLKEKDVNKEKIAQKLEKDSQIRWHRNEYKKLEKRFEEYYVKLEKAIAEREGKISELEKLISIMSE